MKRPSAREWAALTAVLTLCVALRLHNLHVPFVDTSDWRQTDTAAVAYFYYHLGVRLLHPQLWHDGPGPDYTQLELQITPAVAALLAHVFGYGHVLLRSVAVGFFTGSVLALWALVRRRFGPGVALWTALVYSILPVGIFFGRVFQPEPAMCFFGMLALWTVDRWTERRSWGRLCVAVAALAVAVMAKLPNAMLLPPAAALAYGPDLWRWRRMLSAPRLAPVAALVVLPTAAGAAYTLIQGRIAAHGTKYVNFIVTSLGDSYIAGTRHLGKFLWHNVLGMAITPAGALAAAVGLGVLWTAGRRGHWVWVWGAAVLLYAVVVLRAIRFQYYLMPLLPFFALLMGLGLHYLTVGLPRALAVRLPAAEPAPEPPEGPAVARGRPRAGTALSLATPLLAGALVASILSGGLFEIRGYWPPFLPWYQAGRALDRALPRHAVVILSGTYNPTILYYARRHGYRVKPLTMGTLRADVAGGARYVIDQGGLDACMRGYLASNFPEHTYAGIPVYTLHTPLPPPPAGFADSQCVQ